MRSYRTILANKLKDAGYNQRQIASAMGWGNQATVSLRLSGKRDWGEGELRKMCELAGISVAWLAANSDDLILTEHKSSITITSLAEKMTEEQRQNLIRLMESMGN
jgi:transcriptional regulator with XRE-family HTH domain